MRLAKPTQPNPLALAARPAGRETATNYNNNEKLSVRAQKGQPK